MSTPDRLTNIVTEVFSPGQNTTWRMPRCYTAGQVVAAVHLAKSPQQQQNRFAVSWDRTLSAAEYLSWFRSCLSSKINSHDSRRLSTWRKMDPTYQSELRRDSYRINNGRARLSGRNLLSTPELKRRFPNIDNRNLE